MYIEADYGKLAWHVLKNYQEVEQHITYIIHWTLEELFSNAIILV